MIGLFDSGVGGLSVLRELRVHAPSADVLYFGDIANAPYGPKTTEELVTLTLRAMTLLRERDVKQFVVACHSISVSVIQPIVSMFGEFQGPIIEMVEPTAREVAHMDHGKTLVIATDVTVRSGLYERTFRSHGIEVDMLAVPDLAFAIEQGESSEMLQRILEPVVVFCKERNIRTLVLGCTHYSLMKEVITQCVQARVEHPVQVIDPASAVVQEVVSQFDTTGTGEMKFLLSKDSEIFRGYLDDLFPHELCHVELVV